MPGSPTLEDERHLRRRDRSSYCVAGSVFVPVMARLRLFGRLMRSGRADIIALAFEGRGASRSWYSAIQRDCELLASAGGRFEEKRDVPLSCWASLARREGKQRIRGAEMTLVAASVELSARSGGAEELPPLPSAAPGMPLEADVAGHPVPAVVSEGHWLNLMGTG